MEYIFKLPDIGEGIAEGEIVQWFVNENDTIEEDDTLLEIQNDKSIEAIPSPVTGKVVQLHHQVGDVATVGDALVTFDVDELPHAVEEEISEEQSQDVEQEPEVSAIPAYHDKQEEKHVLAMPSVRRYAQEHEVDLTKVTPTGRHNHILKEDIDQFMNGVDEQSVPSTVEETTVYDTAPVVDTTTRQTREPMSATRKAIARAMTHSKQTAPHVTLFDEVEVSALVEHRQMYKTIAAEQNIKLTFLPYIVKALTIVLKHYPILNASIDDKTDEIVYKHYYNIGIATDTEHGLYVPTLKDADTKGLFRLAEEIKDNTMKAYDQRLTAQDMADGTMTITNIGSVGGGFFTPVINHPEVAILGVGTIKKEPVVLENDELGVGHMLKLSLSFDHRIVDGATAQQAMNELKRLLHDPQLLMMEG